MGESQWLGLSLLVMVSVFTWIPWFIGFILRQSNPQHHLFVPSGEYSGSNYAVGGILVVAGLIILIGLIFITVATLLFVGIISIGGRK